MVAYFPGTCRQDSFEVSSLISCTRVHTKTPQWSSRLIQAITVDESLQDSVISFCSSSLTMDVANLVPMVAANNSSFGIVIALTGATLVWLESAALGHRFCIRNGRKLPQHKPPY